MVLLMFLGSLPSVVVMIATSLILLPLGQIRLNRYIIDSIGCAWYRIPIAFFEALFGMRMVFSGDALNTSDRVVLICNHRTRLDWMFLWAFLGRFGRLQNFKIYIKRSLRNLPGPGWAMQFLGFFFLHRKWEKDEAMITSLLEHYADIDYPLQLLIFPEGTNLTLDTRNKSHSFAATQGLSSTWHVLLPRTLGFTHQVQLSRARDAVDAIYDITIAFGGRVPVKETQLLTGHLPQEVHFHVRRYPIHIVPRDVAKLQQWCIDRFVEKENRLTHYARCGSLAMPEDMPPSPMGPSTARDPLRRGTWIDPARPPWMPHLPVIFLWLAVVALWLYIMWCSTSVRWYVAPPIDPAEKSHVFCRCRVCASALGLMAIATYQDWDPMAMERLFHRRWHRKA